MAAIPSKLRVTLPPGHQKSHCAGDYDLVVGETANGQPIWKLRGCDRWIYSSPRGVWYISAKDTGNFDFSAEAGYLRSGEAHNGCYPQAVLGKWQSVSWRANAKLTIEALDNSLQELRVDGVAGESAGDYKLVTGLTANGQPVWMRQSGQRYLYSGTDGNWWIGNSDVEKLKFECSQGYIGSREPHNGVQPHEVKCTWKEVRWSEIDASVTELAAWRAQALQMASRALVPMRAGIVEYAGYMSRSTRGCITRAGANRGEAIQECLGLSARLSAKARERKTDCANACAGGMPLLTAQLRERTAQCVRVCAARMNDLKGRARSAMQLVSDPDVGQGAHIEATMQNPVGELQYHTWDEQVDTESFKYVEVVCPGVSHGDIEVELITNGCIVKISRAQSPGRDAISWSHRFQFRQEEGLFEFEADKAKLEQGIFHMVFRASRSNSRIWRFPSHFNMAAQDDNREWNFPEEERSDSYVSPEGTATGNDWEITQAKQTLECPASNE